LVAGFGGEMEAPRGALLNTLTIQVGSGAGEVTLDQAIKEVDAAGAVNATLNIDPGTHSAGTQSAPLDFTAFDNAQANVVIDGEGATITGYGAAVGLRVLSGNVTLDDLTFSGASAVGGAGGDGLAGGGGGAGLGGGLFVGDDAIVTLSHVAFDQDTAIGGSGGLADTDDTASGGGGGMGGSGGEGGPATGLGGGGGGGLGLQAAAYLAANAGLGIVVNQPASAGVAYAEGAGGAGEGQAQNVEKTINIMGWNINVGSYTDYNGSNAGGSWGGGGGLGAFTLSGGGGVGGQASSYYNDGTTKYVEFSPWTLAAPAFSETGAGTALSLAENLTYVGALTQGAGASLAVASGDALTLKGTTSLAGAINGAGALSQTAGSATISSGAKLGIAKFSITGSGTSAALNESLLYAGTFTDGAGTTLTIASGDIFTLTGTTSLGGAITGAGALTIAGGATMVGNTAALSTARWTISGAATTATIAGGLVSYGGVFTLNAGATASIASKDTLKLTGTSNISGTIAGAGTLDIAGGAATFLSGAQVTAAAWTLATAGATTIAENLSYGGAFSQAAVPTLGVTTGDAFTLTGSSTLNGLVKGAGTLALSGGTSTIAGGAVLNISNWSIDATAVTLAKNLAYVGGFTARDGATLTLSGASAALTLTAHATFNGATVNGSGVLFTTGPVGVGSTTLEGLTVGGGVAWTNARTITQNGGGLTLGDASNGAAKLTNAKAGVYDITDDHGVAAGNAAAAIANAGIFEKTAGTGDSLVAPAISNTGLIEATSGTLELQGAISASGSLAVGGGANLRLDGTVAATQTLSYASGQGTLSLNDLDVGGQQLFHGTIHGWATNDLLDVGTAFGAGTLFNFVENKGHTGGVLNLSDNGATAAINFSGLGGVVTSANFASSVNAAGETVFGYHA
jgi:hypothetical protein